MNYLTACLFLFCSFAGAAQINGHFSFNYKFTNLSDDQVEEQRVEVYSSKNFFTISSEFDGFVSESVIVDRSKKEAVELMKYVINENYTEKLFSLISYTDSIDESSYKSFLMGRLLWIRFSEPEIEFLPETKSIFGLTCQKFVLHKSFVSEPGEYTDVEGWVIPNSHCSIDGKQNFLDTKMGMILEMKVDFGFGIQELKCLAYDPDFSESDEIYNTNVPAGYTKME